MASAMVLDVLYRGNDPRTYQGIEACIDGTRIGVFDTGIPRKDYLNAVSFAYLPLTFSATFDRFIQDGGSFSRDSELVTDRQIIVLFDEEEFSMHNGTHDPKEEAAYNKVRLNTLANADRVGLVNARFDKNLREQMTVEEAVELSGQIDLVEYLEGTVG